MKMLLLLIASLCFAVASIASAQTQSGSTEKKYTCPKLDPNKKYERNKTYSIDGWVISTIEASDIPTIIPTIILPVISPEKYRVYDKIKGVFILSCYSRIDNKPVSVNLIVRDKKECISHNNGSFTCR